MIKQNTTRDNATRAAFLLAEERACAGYLEARKAMAASARRLDSLNQLLAKRPNRLDYRRARDKEMSAYEAAVERTRLAWNSWQRAQLRSDEAWTATKGRHPRVLGGEVAA
ncbi:hypothetical protein [Saccharopolyspora sp. ASAGF58]|uniref:hypothetical protein n=1 Tax=Saccharopolyspora sp. ASAGF58 TaxID=2719023 RepID=UPI00143FFD4E|nr:hypothetical protein [Saccharopolyspora sp. ASAGF58]QIZ33940.1 hypothetical protein FDZ84_03340 [Saccharopolyspora sp. ASAGF58]